MVHPPEWLHPRSLSAATEVQREIAAAVETDDRIGAVRIIAGADTSSGWLDRVGPIHAAIAPHAWPSGLPRAPATRTEQPPFQYVPGYLGFREVPALLAAWDDFEVRPELLLVDGHGRAHPRRCGVACHLGVLLDVPTIGVAKTLLCGAVEHDVGPAPGDRAAIIDRGEIVGMALRTRARATPVFVGIGHRVSLETATDWTLRLALGRRLPLSIRLAHDAANAARRGWVVEPSSKSAH